MQTNKSCLATLKVTASTEAVAREVAGVVVNAFVGRAGVSRILPSVQGGYHCFISVYGRRGQ